MFDLSFDSDGRLCYLCADGMEFANTGSSRLFTVQLRDFAGNPVRLSREDFTQCRVGESSGLWELTFSGVQLLPQISVKLSVRCDGEESRWSLEVFLDREELAVEWMSFPEVPLLRPPASTFLLPYAEGTMVSDLEKRQNVSYFSCREASYPLTGVSNFYPGPAAMQFEALCNPGGSGLYFGVEDRLHSPKTIDFMPDGADGFYPFIQHFTGGAAKTGYDTIIRGFHGNWQDAAEIYRDYLEKNDLLPAKLADRAPQWLMEHPVLLIYPVKGYGIDHGDMSFNEFYPYDRALPVIGKYRELWKHPLMPLLIHWEGTAPWAPPYVWPPAGGVEMLQNFIDRMHAEGNRVGLYCSGIGWTQQSMIDRSYDRRREFEEKELINEVCRGPHGEAFALVCNGPSSQRIGYELCPSRKFTVDTVCGQVSSAAEASVDYLQYFDQNQGCASPLCYSKKHGHPDLPGAWATADMRELLHKAVDSGKGMVIGCENAAAQPYTDSCKLNDLRYHLAWGAGGMPVPLYPYLFHEYTAGFSGNGVCLAWWIDMEKTPFFLLWQLAWNFAYGNFLSVVLKNGGDIHWNWAIPWTDPMPEQEPICKLMANLARLRRELSENYLAAGRMLKAPEVECGTNTVYPYNFAPVEVPRIVASSWQGIDGKIITILVNYNAEDETCTVSGKTVTVPAYNAIVTEQ